MCATCFYGGVKIKNPRPRGLKNQETKMEKIKCKIATAKAAYYERRREYIDNPCRETLAAMNEAKKIARSLGAII